MEDRDTGQCCRYDSYGWPDDQALRLGIFAYGLVHEECLVLPVVDRRVQCLL